MGIITNLNIEILTPDILFKETVASSHTDSSATSSSFLPFSVFLHRTPNLSMVTGGGPGPKCWNTRALCRFLRWHSLLDPFHNTRLETSDPISDGLILVTCYKVDSHTIFLEGKVIIYEILKVSLALSSAQSPQTTLNPLLLSSYFSFFIKKLELNFTTKDARWQ